MSDKTKSDKQSRNEETQATVFIHLYKRNEIGMDEIKVIKHKRIPTSVVSHHTEKSGGQSSILPPVSKNSENLENVRITRSHKSKATSSTLNTSSPWKRKYSNIVDTEDRVSKRRNTSSKIETQNKQGKSGAYATRANKLKQKISFLNPTNKITNPKPNTSRQINKSFLCKFPTNFNVGVDGCEEDTTSEAELNGSHECQNESSMICDVDQNVIDSTSDQLPCIINMNDPNRVKRSKNNPENHESFKKSFNANNKVTNSNAEDNNITKPVIVEDKKKNTSPAKLVEIKDRSQKTAKPGFANQKKFHMPVLPESSAIRSVAGVKKTVKFKDCFKNHSVQNSDNSTKNKGALLGERKDTKNKNISKYTNSEIREKMNDLERRQNITSQSEISKNALRRSERIVEKNRKVFERHSPRFSQILNNSDSYIPLTNSMNNNMPVDGTNPLLETVNKSKDRKFKKARNRKLNHEDDNEDRSLAFGTTSSSSAENVISNGCDTKKRETNLVVKAKEQLKVKPDFAQLQKESQSGCVTRSSNLSKTQTNVNTIVKSEFDKNNAKLILTKLNDDNEQNSEDIKKEIHTENENRKKSKVSTDDGKMETRSQSITANTCPNVRRSERIMDRFLKIFN